MVIYLKLLRNCPTLESMIIQIDSAVFSHYLSFMQQVQIIFALLGAAGAIATADYRI
jgi:hypothetical protein